MRILFAALLLACSLGTASAHPSHATMALVEWDEDRLEVALQLQAADLNQALSAQKPSEKAYEASVEALIRRGILLRDGKGRLVPLEWVGVEEAKFGVWVYFQWTLKGPIAQHHLEHTLFYETEPRTLHTVNFKRGKERRTRTFRFGEKPKSLPTFEKAAVPKP